MPYPVTKKVKPLSDDVFPDICVVDCSLW